MLECWRNILRILKGSYGPRVTDAASGRVQIDASQEGGEFGSGHLDAIGRGGRNAESPPFESFGPDGQAIAVPIQDLDAIAAFVDRPKVARLSSGIFGFRATLFTLFSKG